MLKSKFLSLIIVFLVPVLCIAQEPSRSNPIKRQTKRVETLSEKHNDEVIQTSEAPSLNTPPPAKEQSADQTIKEAEQPQVESDNNDIQQSEQIEESEAAVHKQSEDPNEKKTKPAPKKTTKLLLKNITQEQIELIDELYNQNIKDLESIKEKAKSESAQETMMHIDEMIAAAKLEHKQLVKKIEREMERESTAEAKAERVKSSKLRDKQSSRSSKSYKDDSSDIEKSSSPEKKKRSRPSTRSSKVYETEN